VKIAIIGIGGVGGYFGGKLAKLLEQEVSHPGLGVYFAARNQHLKEIQNYGLILHT
jgi:2-dehydropantoate 2-reductase